MEKDINAEDALISLSIFADDYTLLPSWGLVQWCQDHGANAWTVNMITVLGADAELFARFEEAMTPFRCQTASQEHLNALATEQFVRPTELWQFTSASFLALQEFLPDGLFTYEPSADEWFEDLTFYRNGELMLGVVSHEREGFLRVTAEEKTQLEREGFPFRLFGECVDR